jgi:hypothetical protein
VDADLNGDEVAFTRNYGPVTSDWDFSASATASDIFWRHDSGQLVSWEVDDGAIIGYNHYGHVPNDYEIVGAATSTATTTAATSCGVTSAARS